MKGARNSGEIVGMNPHHSDRDHVSVRVAHGKRKAKPKSKKGDVYPSGDYDDRPSTEVVVRKDHAKKFALGDQVMARLEHVDDGDEDDAGESIASMKKSAASGLHRAMRGKSSGLGSKRG